MITYVIKGGRPLKGQLKIAGRKNAALPIIAATLLTSGTVTIKNAPEISDVSIMLRVLTALGANVKKKPDGAITVNTAAVGKTSIPHNLGRRLRGSILFLGPLLARFGRLTFPHPGGCIIGKRPVGLHFDVLERLGARFTRIDEENYSAKANRLRGTDYFLTEASVTATENALMAAVLAAGSSTLMNAAAEDHVRQLILMLNELGYGVTEESGLIKVAGSNGQLSNKSLTVNLIADEIELGTFITAALVSGGRLILTNVGNYWQIRPVLAAFEQFGVKISYDADDQSVSVAARGQKLHPAQIKTGIWPGIPTDLQPALALLATQINGNTLIHDWMYEGRFVYGANLEKMGARVLNCDPHRILVQGKTPLVATKMVSPDLRAGVTQLIAALAAKGESRLEHAELIERGYENIVDRLTAVGASIERAVQ